MSDYFVNFTKDIYELEALPLTNITTPCNLISCDTSYTKSWTLKDWDEHCQVSILRYYMHAMSWSKSTTAHHILPTIGLIGIWSSVVSILSSKVLFFSTNPSKFAVTLTFLQAPIVLLLTLRTNRALDRLLESRKAWGALTRSARCLMGVVCSHVLPHHEELALIVGRYLALFGWSLKGMLRGQDDKALVKAIFSNDRQVADIDEANWLLNCKSKRPVAILCRLRHLCSTLTTESIGKNRNIMNRFSRCTTKKNEGMVSPVVLLRIEELLYDMETCVGILGRILMSPIPPTYTRHTSRVLVLYLTFLPVALAGIGSSPLSIVLTCIFASYVLVGIDEIGCEIEHPFPLLPMQHLAKALQNEIVEQVAMSYTMP